jgi:O-antigen/teichoic acid export membrane protein
MPASGFARNVLTLFTGSTIAQAIPLLVSPILTRIFPVSDFAILTIITSVVSLIGVICTGRYELAIMLPEKDDDARQIVYLSMLLAIATAGISMLFFLFFRDEVAGLLNNIQAAPYLLFVPVVVLFYGWNQALTYWNIRKRQYPLLASSRVSHSIVNSGVSLSSGYSAIPFNGLVAGNVLGQVAAFVYTYISSNRKKEIRINPNEINKNEIKRLAGKYSDFPRINSLQSFAEIIQSTGVVFVISAFFGNIITGLYGFTLKILQAPLNMMGNSIAIVFYKEASEKYNRQEALSGLVKKTMVTLAVLAFPVFLLLMIWGEEIFALVFGSEWREAGVYAGILSPWLFMSFVVSPVSQLPIILKKQKQVFLISLFGNSLLLGGIIVGALVFRDIHTGFIIVSVSQFLYYAGVIWYFLRIATNLRYDSLHQQE